MKHIVFFFFFTLTILYAQNQFEISDLKANRNKKYIYIQFKAHLSKTDSNLYKNDVPISTEPIFISGKAWGRVYENNFLGSKLRYDLNGDNDTQDSFLISKFKPLKPFRVQGQKAWKYYNGKSPKIYHIGEHGRHFCIYYKNYGIPKKILGIPLYPMHFQIGLSSKKSKVVIKKFPNPCLQISIIKKNELPFKEVKYFISDIEINGKQIKPFQNYTSYIYEPIFTRTASWNSISWSVVGLPIQKSSHILCKVVDPNPENIAAVVIFLNSSQKAGSRIRSQPKFTFVK